MPHKQTNETGSYFVALSGPLANRIHHHRDPTPRRDSLPMFADPKGGRGETHSSLHEKESLLYRRWRE